ncbi:hypothetical protein Cpir12675_000252 [Ceratocystis pirilliformis]|uniref:Protein DSF2 n=1 Tax=Ceratocystis pirilliformis TaxID=259994 RepID=A0ABR3ZQF4_9PEZI
MGIRDAIKKKDAVTVSDSSYAAAISRVNTGAEFTFIRSDTFGQSVVHPPGTPPATSSNGLLSPVSAEGGYSGGFRSRSRSNSAASARQKLSHRLHLSRNHSTSDNVPANLPAIETSQPDAETQWEKRATILAMGGSQPGSPNTTAPSPIHATNPFQWSAPQSNKELDSDIQRAIRLHEEGDLTNSTRIFAKLANPAGANNPLSQVLYGLALRHGWGCAPDPELAVSNLGLAAANAAAIEQRALEEGKKQGGPAKGELVLAIYELANCFRNGWGVGQDPVAAKQGMSFGGNIQSLANLWSGIKYFETAANLGDTDAMNEVAFCYLEGFGCRKDKTARARIA